jgi:hypothetical protein
MTLLSRRTFAAAVPALAAAGASKAATAPQPPGLGPLSGAALHADVVRYADFPTHRTATPGDVARSDWIYDELRLAHQTVRRMPFSITRHDLTSYGLVIDGHRFAPLDAYPLWQPINTPADGVTGPLTMAGSNRTGMRDAIAYLEVDGLIELSLLPQQLGEAARQGARAAVVMAVTPSGELFGHGLRAPPALPTLMVGAKHRERLLAAATAKAQAKVLIQSEAAANAQAYEVEGRLDRGLKRIVVSTPTSAWFASAGERGPGVALFLGLARWLAGRQGEVSYTFVASSGHELYGLGKRSYLEAHAPKPAYTLAWLHLGASIAVYEFERAPDGIRSTGRAQRGSRLLTNDDGLLSLLQHSFQGVGQFEPRKSTDARGELGLMFEAGYRAFGFEGGHAYFHAPNDLPFVTGSDILEPVGDALRRTLLALEAGAAT